jgi:hypothetical protein
MKKIVFLIFILISIRCFAQFNEPVQINDQNVANIAGESSYKIIGENVYITYLEEYYSLIFEHNQYKVIFKFSEDNGHNFVTTVVDSAFHFHKVNPVLEVLSDGTIIVIYSRGDFYKAISIDNGNSFQIDFLTSGSYKPVHTTNQNDIIYLAVENCFYENFEIQNNTFQIENILPATTRDISQIEQNGIRPFPADAEIVYVKIDGNNYSSRIGNIEYIGDSLFVVYNSYPDAAHPDFPIGDSIWVNEVAIYDTIWTAGPSGTLNNQSVWVECVLWIEGMVGGLQSWGCPENIYITNDIYYENTEIGSIPNGLFNFNITDLLCLYSEDRILIKYKHFDPFINEIAAPNCDGDVYVYGFLIAIGYTTGCVDFEYQHPHGSTPDFWWTNPATGEEELLTYIDLHKYIFNPTEPVPTELEPFVLHGNNPPAGFPACGFPYESSNYPQPDISPYGTGYPWYNPVWPESSEDIIYERGIFHFYGAMAQTRRGFIHMSGIEPFFHPPNNEWDIENYHYDGTHNSVGYWKDYYGDRRFLFQSLIDISNIYKPITDSYKVLRSIDNGNSFTILDEQTLSEAIYNLQMRANDSLLIVAYQESGDPLINLKLYDENGSIDEYSIDLSSFPEIVDPDLLNIKLIDALYVHISNSDYLYFNNEDEFIIKYNMENNEIENITSFEPDYNLTNFNISNDDLKIFITCEMFNDELNPEPLTLHFNYSNDDNWNDVYNFETDFVNFVPYSSKIALNFNELDSLFFLINVTDSLYSFGNLFLLTGSIDFSTGYSEEEIIKPGYSLQSYPNPFNPETKIVFNLPEEGDVKLEIYNIKGQKVKTFDAFPNRGLGTSEYSVVWNGKDSNNKEVASGIYFYKLV